MCQWRCSGSDAALTVLASDGHGPSLMLKREDYKTVEDATVELSADADAFPGPTADVP
jgi:hypothetical protein